MWIMYFLLMTAIGISFIFLMTILGSAVVFCFKKEISLKFNALCLGLASGIMLAAAIWSLILPALTRAETNWQSYAFIPVAIGIILGAVSLFLFDKWISRLKQSKILPLEGHRRLFLAVTLHNVPEGLAVGFAFGAAWVSGIPSAFVAAMGIAIGIGVQNLPEGMAVSMPLSASQGRGRAFLYGAISGVIEPVFAVIGIMLAKYLSVLQPWLLSAAAGAMIFVVVADLIPDIHKEKSVAMIGNWGILFGFILMMILDVALG